MKAADHLEEMVAETIPHHAECYGRHGLVCSCGATARRAKLLLHVSQHVERLTRGKVYLDGPTPAP